MTKYQITEQQLLNVIKVKTENKEPTTSKHLEQAMLRMYKVMPLTLMKMNQNILWTMLTGLHLSGRVVRNKYYWELPPIKPNQELSERT